MSVFVFLHPIEFILGIPVGIFLGIKLIAFNRTHPVLSPQKKGEQKKGEQGEA